MSEEELRELLQEIGHEALPPDALVRVRLKIAERVQERPSRKRWQIAAICFATACLSMVALLFRSIAPLQPANVPAIAHRAPAPPQEHSTSLESARDVHRPARHIAVKHQLRPKKESPILIRIETPDPSVVILLVGE